MCPLMSRCRVAVATVAHHRRCHRRHLVASRLNAAEMTKVLFLGMANDFLATRG